MTFEADFSSDSGATEKETEQDITDKINDLFQKLPLKEDRPDLIDQEIKKWEDEVDKTLKSGKVYGATPEEKKKETEILNPEIIGIRLATDKKLFKEKSGPDEARTYDDARTYLEMRVLDQTYEVCPEISPQVEQLLDLIFKLDEHKA